MASISGLTYQCYAERPRSDTRTPWPSNVLHPNAVSRLRRYHPDVAFQGADTDLDVYAFLTEPDYLVP